MILPYIPYRIKENHHTVTARLKAIQEAINGLLHRSNICPKGQFFCGIVEYRLRVVYENGHYEIVEKFEPELNVKSFIEALYRKYN